MAHKSAHKLETGSGLSCQILRLFFSWGAKGWEMKDWLYSARSSLRSSEKTSHSRQSAQPECHNLALPDSAHMACEPGWQHDQSERVWQCCGDHHALYPTYSTQAHYGSMAMLLERTVRNLHVVTKRTEKTPIYSILTSPRQQSPNFMDFLIFLALWQNDSLLSGSSLHSMFRLYLTSERRAGIYHLVLLIFQSYTANRSVQATKTHFCCGCWKIQT